MKTILVVDDDEMNLKVARFILEEKGYIVSGLSRECYIDGIWNKESEEDWLTEIQLPVE